MPRTSKKISPRKSHIYDLNSLREIMVALRSPEGCPWDRAQSQKSLTPFAVEEALELEDAIHEGSAEKIKEELGDLLFQIIFQSQMAQEKNQFTLEDVIDHLCRKMIERHPHVFGVIDLQTDHQRGVKTDIKTLLQKFKKNKKSQKATLSAKSVLGVWEIKKNENQMDSKDKNSQPMKIFNMPKNFPALLAAYKIGKKSRSIAFDWDNAKKAFQHALSEVQELQESLKSSHRTHQEEELGDTLFTLVQVARHLDIDPEKALRRANKKIVGRIRKAFILSALSWREFCALSQEKKDELWQKAKKSN